MMTTDIEDNIAKASPNFPHLVHLRRRHHQCGLIAVSGRLGGGLHSVDDVGHLRWKCLVRRRDHHDAIGTDFKKKTINQNGCFTVGCFTVNQLRVFFENVGRWFWCAFHESHEGEVLPWDETLTESHLKNITKL